MLLQLMALQAMDGAAGHGWCCSSWCCRSSLATHLEKRALGLLATHLDRARRQARRLGQRHLRCGRGLACLGLGLGLGFGAGFGLGLGVFGS